MMNDHVLYVFERKRNKKNPSVCLCVTFVDTISFDEVSAFEQNSVYVYYV